MTRSRDKRPTVWEGAHHLIERLEQLWRKGRGDALQPAGRAISPSSARDLAYRLYHICDRKGWAEDALRLQHPGQQSWSEITRLAASLRAAGVRRGKCLTE